MLETLDAAAVHRWCGGGLEALRAHQHEIDELNVYPVPDGDTGTNLVLTLASAQQELEGSAAGEPTTAREPGGALGRMARGALLGARGNSGVIVSQILRGMADSLTSSVTVRGAELARALRSASEAAYAAVARPVEGTVLSVVAAAADGAGRIKSDDLLAVARAAALAASEALARTPQQLPVLARAGVVDAGGRGLCLLLDALVTALTPAAGSTSTETDPPKRPGDGDASDPPGRPGDSDAFDSAERPGDSDALDPPRRPGDSDALDPPRRPGDSDALDPPRQPGDSDAPDPAERSGGDAPDPANRRGGEAPDPAKPSGGGISDPVSRVGGQEAGDDAPDQAERTAAGTAASGAGAVGGQAGGAVGGQAGGGATPSAAADDGGFGFEVQYLLDAPDSAVGELRRVLDGLGDSLVVVGSGDGVWNVHVHVAADRIGPAVEAGVAAGRPHRISVTPLVPGRAHVPAERPAPRRRGAVVVAAGDGLTALFEAEGATVVGRNPSIREMIDAIARTRAGCVVLLPNDANTHAVATAAAREAEGSGVRVSVVPTRSPVQALAALAVRDTGRPFSDDVIAMAEAAGACRYGEVCTAQRDSLTVAGPCRAGDLLGLVDGEVHVIGADLEDVSRRLLDRMLGGGGELTTLVLGADAPASLEGTLRGHVTQIWPFVELQCYAGGQPRYHLLVGVE